MWKIPIRSVLPFFGEIISNRFQKYSFKNTPIKPHSNSGASNRWEATILVVGILIESFFSSFIVIDCKLWKNIPNMLYMVNKKQRKQVRKRYSVKDKSVVVYE